MARVGSAVLALDDAKSLSKLDATRWEGPALAGVLQAAMGSFPESQKSLEEAARLAPAARRAQIQSASVIARRESTFSDMVNNADQAWEKQQYGPDFCWPTRCPWPCR